jgi:hypothetical protein
MGRTMQCCPWRQGHAGVGVQPVVTARVGGAMAHRRFNAELREVPARTE